MEIELTGLIQAPPRIATTAGLGQALGRSRQHAHKMQKDAEIPPQLDMGGWDRTRLIEWALRRDERVDDLTVWNRLRAAHDVINGEDRADPATIPVTPLRMTRYGILPTTTVGRIAYSLHRDTGAATPPVLVVHDSKYADSRACILAALTPEVFDTDTVPDLFILVTTSHDDRPHRAAGAAMMLATRFDLDRDPDAADARYCDRIQNHEILDDHYLRRTLGFLLPRTLEDIDADDYRPIVEAHLPADWAPDRPYSFHPGWTGEVVAFLRQAHWWFTTSHPEVPQEHLDDLSVIIAHARDELDRLTPAPSLATDTWAGYDLHVDDYGFPPLPGSIDVTDISSLLPIAIRSLDHLGRRGQLPWLHSFLRVLLSQHRVTVSLANLPAALQTRLRDACATQITADTVLPSVSSVLAPVDGQQLIMPITGDSRTLADVYPPTIRLRGPAHTKNAPDDTLDAEVLVTQYLQDETPARRRTVTVPAIAEAITEGLTSAGQRCDVLVRVFADNTITLSRPTPNPRSMHTNRR